MVSMKRYPKLRYPGEEETEGLLEEGSVFIQEKLDGSNFRFTYDLEADEFTFGSRNTVGDELHHEQFAAAIDYITETVDRGYLERLSDDIGDVIIFGEAMNPHTISYDWETTPDFIGFDIWSCEHECFLLPSSAENIITTDLGLPFAPIVDRVHTSEWSNYEFEVPESAFYDGKAEGVVLKNRTTGVYAKYVRDEFKERNKEAFGASNKQDLSDAELLAEEYVPPARVRSVAHQLVDDGEWAELRMEMMEDLPRAVIADMVDEEGSTVFMEESAEPDLGEFRSVVSSRCATVLRQMIDRQAKEQLLTDGGFEVEQTSIDGGDPDGQSTLDGAIVRDQSSGARRRGYECTSCAKLSEDSYRCSECGHDLAGEGATKGRGER